MCPEEACSKACSISCYSPWGVNMDQLEKRLSTDQDGIAPVFKAALSCVW